MRGFFIQWFERVVNIVVVLAAIAIIISGLLAMFGGMYGAGASGFLAGLAIWVIGGLYLVLLAGGLYIGIGIYENTRRTAEAAERGSTFN